MKSSIFDTRGHTAHQQCSSIYKVEPNNPEKDIITELERLFMDEDPEDDISPLTVPWAGDFDTITEQKRPG
jgi:hypothetical protein